MINDGIQNGNYKGTEDKTLDSLKVLWASYTKISKSMSIMKRCYLNQTSLANTMVPQKHMHLTTFHKIQLYVTYHIMAHTRIMLLKKSQNIWNRYVVITILS